LPRRRGSTSKVTGPSSGSKDPMRPLASPVTEYRFGLLTMAGGVVLGVLGAAFQNPGLRAIAMRDEQRPSEGHSEPKRRADRDHRRASRVHGLDDLAAVDALEVDRGDAEVAVPELSSSSSDMTPPRARETSPDYPRERIVCPGPATRFPVPHRAAVTAAPPELSRRPSRKPAPTTTSDHSRRREVEFTSASLSTRRSAARAGDAVGSVGVTFSLAGNS
jgi:hypothetical protein